MFFLTNLILQCLSILWWNKNTKLLLTKMVTILPYRVNTTSKEQSYCSLKLIYAWLAQSCVSSGTNLTTQFPSHGLGEPVAYGFHLPRVTLYSVVINFTTTTGIRTLIAEVKIKHANHYTIGPYIGDKDFKVRLGIVPKYFFIFWRGYSLTLWHILIWKCLLIYN